MNKDIDLTGVIDRKSFALGMITAFCECINGECKKIALSPPMYPNDYYRFKSDAEKVITLHGLNFYYEENKDLDEDRRMNWWVIYKFEDALDEYLQLRNEGYNPLNDFDKFRGVLSYGTAYADGANQLQSKMRDNTRHGTVSDKVMQNVKIDEGRL